MVPYRSAASLEHVLHVQVSREAYRVADRVVQAVEFQRPQAEARAQLQLILGVQPNDVHEYRDGSGKAFVLLIAYLKIGIMFMAYGCEDCC